MKLIKDIIKDCEPLGGIYSELLSSDFLYNFVLVCDMPFINTQLVQYIVDNANGYDLVVPKVDKKLHPLFGIYSKKLIPSIEDMLKKREFKVARIFAKVSPALSKLESPINVRKG